MSETLQDRLKTVRQQLGCTSAEMAERVGLRDRKSWERYERGQNVPKADVLAAIIDLGFSADWLLTGQGRKERLSEAEIERARRMGLTIGYDAQMEIAAGLGRWREQAEGGPALPAGFVLIPRYDVEASAGPGALTGDENIVDYMAFQSGWVRRVLDADPRRLALISAKGDSMEPTIRAGDLLLVDTGVDRFVDDAIYVVLIEGHLLVKRVQLFMGGAVTVKSDNPSYIEQTLSPDEAAGAVVAGRVRWIGRLI